MNKGVLGAIVQLGKINEGKDDAYTHNIVKQTIKAMTEKKRNLWPDKELRKIVNEMDNIQRGYFLETLKEMDEALEEYFSGKVVEV